MVNENPLKSYCDVDSSYCIGEIVGGLFYYGSILSQDGIVGESLSKGGHSILDNTAVVPDNKSAEEVKSLARAN